MLRLTSLEVYIFNITKENDKFELFKFPDSKTGDLAHEKVGGEIEKDLEISDITATDLHDDTVGPIVIEEYREQVTKRMKDDE